MKKTGKVFVAGPASAARNAVVRRLKAHGLGDDQIDTREDCELNLSDQVAVRAYLREAMPEKVYITTRPRDDSAENPPQNGTRLTDALLGPVQLIHEAMYAGVKKLLFVASHEVYGPCPVLPMAEEDLPYARTGQYRTTLAIANSIGIQLCEAYNTEFGDVLGLQYRSVVVGHLFGPEVESETSTTGELRALMRHIHQAHLFKLASVTIRANGQRRSDWLYVDDMAEACIQVLEMPESKYQTLTQPGRPQLNLGSGRAHSMQELAEAVARVVGYPGHLNVESALDDVGHDFFLDTHRMRSTGWEPQVGLEVGLHHMYRAYRQRARNVASA